MNASAGGLVKQVITDFGDLPTRAEHDGVFERGIRRNEHPRAAITFCVDTEISRDKFHVSVL